MEDRAQKTSDSNSDCAHRVEKRLCVSGHAIDLKVFGHDQENIDILGAYFAVTKLPQIKRGAAFHFGQRVPGAHEGALTAITFSAMNRKIEPGTPGGSSPCSVNSGSTMSHRTK
jgi:hypothetical protein